jgi:hypothetical protein
MEKTITDTRKLLLNYGQYLAKEFSGYTNESCVVAVFNKDKFLFTGVQVIAGSMRYSSPGTVVDRKMGHVLSQILHAGEISENVKEDIRSGKISFGYKRTAPEWEEYNSALISGLQSGVFLENSWCYSDIYRIAIPVFTSGLLLAGAFMCGHSNKNILAKNMAEYFISYLKVMNRIPDYEAIFDAGIKRIRENSNFGLHNKTLQ